MNTDNAFMNYIQSTIEDLEKFEEKKPMKKYRCKIDSPFGKKGSIIDGDCPIPLDEKTTSNGMRVSLGMYRAQDYPDIFEEVGLEKKEVLMSPQIEENHVWPDPGYPRSFKSLGELQKDKPLKIVIKNFRFIGPGAGGRLEEIFIKEAEAELWIPVEVSNEK